VLFSRVMTLYNLASWQVLQNYTVVRLICLLASWSKPLNELLVQVYRRKLELVPYTMLKLHGIS